MAFRKITQNQRTSVTLECDPDKESPTRFEVRALSAREEARLQDRVVTAQAEEAEAKGDPSASTLTTHVNEVAFERVRAGLVGWENFQDDGGAEVPFPVDRATGRITREALDHWLPLEAVKELSTQILKLSGGLSEEEEGNSEG